MRYFCVPHMHDVLLLYFGICGYAKGWVKIFVLKNVSFFIPKSTVVLALRHTRVCLIEYNMYF